MKWFEITLFGAIYLTATTRKAIVSAGDSQANWFTFANDSALVCFVLINTTHTVLHLIYFHSFSMAVPLFINNCGRWLIVPRLLCESIVIQPSDIGQSLWNERWIAQASCACIYSGTKHEWNGSNTNTPLYCFALLIWVQFILAIFSPFSIKSDHFPATKSIIQFQNCNFLIQTIENKFAKQK